MNLYKNTVLFLIFSAVLSSFLFGNSSSSALFKKADELFIINKNEEAVKLYKQVVKNNDDKRLVMLSLYKLGYNYEKRLFDYQESLKWYRELVRRYPASRHAKMAIDSINRMEQIIRRGEGNRYVTFEKMRWDYYITRNKDLTAKEKKNLHKKKADKLYEFTKKNFNTPFSDRYIQETFNIMLNDRHLGKADRLFRKAAERNSSFKENNSDKIIWLKKNLNRLRLYILAWVLLAAVLGSSVIFGSLMDSLKSMAENFKLIWWVFAAGFFVVLIIYIALYSSIADAGFRVFNFIMLIFTFLLSLIMTGIYYGLFEKKNMAGVSLIVIRVSGILVGGACWFIYAYIFDYLSILGL